MQLSVYIKNHLQNNGSRIQKFAGLWVTPRNSTSFCAAKVRSSVFRSTNQNQQGSRRDRATPVPSHSHGQRHYRTGLGAGDASLIAQSTRSLSFFVPLSYSSRTIFEAKGRHGLGNRRIRQHQNDPKRLTKGHLPTGRSQALSRVYFSSAEDILSWNDQLATVRRWRGKPPVGITLLLRGTAPPTSSLVNTFGSKICLLVNSESLATKSQRRPDAGMQVKTPVALVNVGL
jgi:hypothetical protein